MPNLPQSYEKNLIFGTLLVIFHVEQVAVRILDSERRTHLRKHHLLCVEFDLGGSLATAVSLAYVRCAVGYVRAQHIGRNIEYYCDVGYFQVYACKFFNLL